jgi:hypothetical protein
MTAREGLFDFLLHLVLVSQDDDFVYDDLTFGPDFAGTCEIELAAGLVEVGFELPDAPLLSGYCLLQLAGWVIGWLVRG